MRGVTGNKDNNEQVATSHCSNISQSSVTRRERERERERELLTLHLVPLSLWEVCFEAGVVGMGGGGVWAVVVGAWVAVVTLGPALTDAWIPFFGQELHKHLNLESHHREWDVLGLLSINTTQAGVSSARGPLPDTPAWRLRDPYDNIQLDPDLVPKIASTLHDELSLYFVFKQHKKTLGSLLSINLPGKIKPFLQVVSNLKTQRLNFFYHVKEDSKTHQASFHLPDKVGWTWTRLLLSVNQTDARLWVNCAHYHKMRLAGHIDLQIPPGGLLYFRQEPGLKNKLIGSIQMAKLMNYSVESRIWRCSYDSQFGPSWRPPLLG